MSRKGKKISKHGGQKRNDELFVFGYASKLFRDDKIAEYHEEGRHLIPWPGDDSLLIDRYDCRLLFTEKSQFESKAESLSHSLSLEEQEIKRLCDEERYLELHTNLEEQEIEHEEEMKRFKEALSQDGAYSSVGFSYDNSEQENTAENMPPSASGTHPPQEPTPSQVVEKFVAPEELEVPDGMEIPDTAKMNAIIEKTAVFVSGHGTQMEILVKAKQAGNPQFDFLNFDNWLNPYYKHMLKYIKEGKYEPVTQPASPEQQQEPEPESEEEDSDGEFELHPSLTASHRSASCTPNSSAPSSPAPTTNIGDQYNYPSSAEASVVSYPLDAASSGSIQQYYSTVWTQHNQVAGGYHYASGSSTHLVASAPIMTAADMLPPPPPPPGEGPLEGEWLGTDATHVHHVQPHSHYPTQNNINPGVMQNAVHLIGGHPAVMMTSTAPAPIVPPSPDIQPIIDKLAMYVVKNGPEFENIIKTKNDPRFAFVHPWNENHQYYVYKKRLSYEQIEQERRKAATKETKPTATPISFSIKPKEVSKPKIEYRTNVIFKQSCETGESEDEENKEDSDESSNGNESEKVESSGTEQKIETHVNTGSPVADLEMQMKSIEAAEKEAQRLEVESQSQREKQLQIERKRKASLFISMLKKTSGAEEQNKGSESDKKSIESNGSARRHFTESKRPSDTKIDMFEEKKAKYDGALLSGVGAPSPDIIKATQDLMAKVRAASRTNR
ncbi:splicing factor, suppressor of white-apricot homolog isoform X2 [Actinia tenebrosa]|uniref:Splicing factor, suppressor of white-apricot homolog isoform X2 n=1 Tax=Actinia tenebrosa TaxID=6105 RepID=A0A6P8INU9_ACTTE|nr:splicing factor, suppressor of white-apricot homolog isoform X2 [Actinia tenebrosa]